MEWTASREKDRDTEPAICRVDGKAFPLSADVFSPKGIWISAQGKRVIEVVVAAIAGALKGHGNGVVAIRFKK